RPFKFDGVGRKNLPVGRNGLQHNLGRRAQPNEGCLSSNVPSPTWERLWRPWRVSLRAGKRRIMRRVPSESAPFILTIGRQSGLGSGSDSHSISKVAFSYEIRLLG